MSPLPMLLVFINLMPGDVRGGILHVGEVAVSTVPQPDGPMIVGARPEHLVLHTTHTEAMVPARVDIIEPLGSHVLVTALVEETRMIVQAPAGTELDAGTRIGLEMPPERTYFFAAETGDVWRSREHMVVRPIEGSLTQR